MWIDIDSNINEAIQGAEKFFQDQMRYVMLVAVNNTARDVQRNLRGSTLPAVIKRNRALPRAMTYFIPDDASGQGGLFRTSNFLRTKDTIVIGPVRDSRNGYHAGSGFSERQVTGATKTPKGSAIAIPNEGPGLKRLSGGAIPKAKRPGALRGKDKFFVKDNKIFERMGAKGNKIRLRYVLAKQAKGTNILGRFYPDSFNVVDQVFPGHFTTAMTRAIRSSGFVER